MDSPVIMDTASKFGRNLDPGFPFDDQGFGRLGDIRSQLDNLASRHPEFADHLLGPPWGDVPLHGTLRNKRRGSGSGNSHQGHPDEDARSQASGSSAASAASGASGVSSHGEPEQMYHHHQNIPNNIPQYGLRNTMDIGQHHHNMDNAEKINREQRSASAPPENRQQMKEETDEKRSMPKPQQQQQQQQSTMPQQQQQSNVRHIPIFVEGRDEPVIPKNIDEPTISARQQSPSGFYSTQFDDTPSKFSTPPHFQRPSTFNQHFGNRHRDWSPHFQDTFTDVFDHPSVRRTSQPTQSTPFRQSRQQHHQQQQQPPQPPSSSSPPQQQFEKRPPHNEYTYCNPQMGQSQSTIPEKQEAPQEQPKRTIFTPKDPLEKVDIIQKEVDSLTEQIKLWNGNSKADKQYIYLDEMLTRELIKLDDIETEGKDNVRQARKNTIKSIQNSISLLESKVSSAQSTIESQSTDEQQITGEVETKEMESIPVSEASEQENKTEAIPLPALPSSPTKESAENIESVEGKQTTSTCNNDTMQLDEPQTSQTEATSAVMEVEQNNSVDNATPQNTQESNQTQSETVETTDKEETNVTSKNGKSPKKLRKTKKQPPISKEPIPLPAAENNCLNVK